MTKKKEFLVVIPARMGSTRFPGKVLADLGGRPMVEWCRQAAIAADIGPVIIATEDKTVADALRPLRADVVITSARCQSGTDRVWEAAQKRLRPNIRFIMNLQGDEPLIAPQAIKQVAGMLRKSRCDIATAVVPADEQDADNPNAVKVALARDGRCLYFSRAPIPFPRNSAHTPSPSSSLQYFKHIGIYAFRRAALSRFVKLSPSPLERRESLEQLRALEAGMTIAAAVVQSPAIAIDTIEDLERARRTVARNQKIFQGALSHG